MFNLLAKIGAPTATVNSASWPQVQMCGQSQAAFQSPAGETV